MTIVEFLQARYDEEEREARALNDGRWRAVAESGAVVREEEAFLLRHDPSRVLREVETHRTLVAQLVDAMDGDYAPWNEECLRTLAAVYSDHPDYREDLPL